MKDPNSWLLWSSLQLRRGAKQFHALNDYIFKQPNELEILTTFIFQK